MSEVVILRTYKHSTIEEFSKNSSVPVINALSDREHPCQALCDLLTIREKTGENLKNISITFVGDGNNVATSLAKAILTYGGTFIHSCPKGYEIPKEDLIVIDDLQKKYDGNFSIENDINMSVKNSDIVYTDVGQAWDKNLNKIKELKILKTIKLMNISLKKTMQYLCTICPLIMEKKFLKI